MWKNASAESKSRLSPFSVAPTKRNNLKMTLINGVGQSDMMRALRGEATEKTPCWLMRQAGRYLPEYRETRKHAGSFLDLCFSPELATEVTLQPLRRFDLQAAILFSDILTIPWALGQHLEFQEGEGPVLEPITNGTELARLKTDGFLERLEPVMEAVQRIRGAMPGDMPLIGFVGAPWTLATYSIAGRGTKDQAPAKNLLVNDPETFDQMLGIFEDCCFELLSAQIGAGANIAKIFDSWAGSLSPTMLQRASVDPIRRIVMRLKEKHPQTPVIVFPRGIGPLYPEFCRSVEPHAVAIDQGLPLEWASNAISGNVTLQGNLDPIYLTGPKSALERELEVIKAAMSGKPHIFNLGHGITPDAKIENVSFALEYMRS